MDLTVLFLKGIYWRISVAFYGCPMGNPWVTHGPPVVGSYAWATHTHGLPMGYPWATIQSSRPTHGLRIDYAWSGLPLKHHGLAMGLPLDTMCFPWVFQEFQ